MSETAFKTMDDFIAESAEEAREQGREQGELLMRRAYLKNVLNKHFHDVPQNLLDRIDAIDDTTRLADLFEQALTAKSLDEIAL